jgi:putative ABC transport system permease protein
VPQIVSSSLSLQRLGMTLMLIFAGTTLGLAAIGIYGVIAYASAQRVGEVATRMALGATSKDGRR